MSLVNVHIPKLGMEMMEATLTEWLVKDGEYCEEGNVIAILDTDKVSHELEATASGYVRIVGEPGTLYPVGEVIGLIAETEDELRALQEPDAPRIGQGALADVDAVADEDASVSMPSARALASPAARTKAQSLGLDLSTIVGTGPRGLITADDIEAAAQVNADPEASSDGSAGRGVQARFPLAGMRRIIAERMMTSLQSSAQVTSWFSVDATALAQFRTEFAVDARPSYAAIIVAALARTLRNHPAFNSSIHGETALIWDCVNVGVAVGFARPEELTDGLVVPVLRDADTKSVTTLSQELATKLRAANEGTLPVDDIQGGTFTLSSVGNVRNVVWNGSTPILNGDETGILWAGAIRSVPVVRDGAVVVGSELPIALTQDHRLVDGIAAGRFIGELTETLQSPETLRDLESLRGEAA